MSQMVRHILQPRSEVEVSDEEASVLRSQGLLYEGDLEALLAGDPVGPLDPPYRRDQPPSPPIAAVAAKTTITAIKEGA